MLRFAFLAGCLMIGSASAQGLEPSRAGARVADKAPTRVEAIRAIQRSGCSRVQRLVRDMEGTWIGEALCGGQVVDVAVSEQGEVVAWPSAPALARHPDAAARQPPLN